MKKLIFLLIISFISNVIFSQKSSDIGLCISTSNNNSHILNLEYRNHIKDKWNYNIGLTAGGYSSQSKSIWGVSDTMITTRHYIRSNSVISLITGFDRKIKSSIFSYGLNLAFGYRKYSQGNYSSHSIYDSITYPLSNSSYYNSSGFGSINIRDLNADNRNTIYFSSALQIALKANIPINKHFLFAINCIYSFDVGYKINEQNFSDYNSFNDLQTSPTLLGGGNGNGHSINLGIGLRYIFLKKKEENNSN